MLSDPLAAWSSWFATNEPEPMHMQKSSFPSSGKQPFFGIFRAAPPSASTQSLLASGYSQVLSMPEGSFETERSNSPSTQV